MLVRYFTYIFLGVKPFLYYQTQGHLSRSGSNIKVTVFEKTSIAGALVFDKHSLLFLKTLSVRIVLTYDFMERASLSPVTHETNISRAWANLVHYYNVYY